MDDQASTLLPGVLDDGGVADVGHLLGDVELAQAVQAPRWTEARELIGMEAADIADVPQPVVDQAMTWDSSAALTPPQP